MTVFQHRPPSPARRRALAPRYPTRRGLTTFLLHLPVPHISPSATNFASGLAFRSVASGATVRLDSVIVADPCVEFSRYSLGEPAASPQGLKPVLQFLGDGVRGYCFTPAGDLRLVPGDVLVAG